LFPALFAIGTILVFFQVIKSRFHPEIWLSLTSLNFWFGSPSLISPSWTLQWEITFYALVAAAIVLNKGKLTVKNFRTFALILLILNVFCAKPF
jgi:peptidoglycan/LPS O-acetylase OafA/YrhL